MILLDIPNNKKAFKYTNDLLHYIQTEIDYKIETLQDAIEIYNIQWNVEQRIEHYKAMIGKNVSLMSFGEPTTGVVEDVDVRPDCIWIHVKHKPVQWGRRMYNRSSVFERREDLFGSARYLSLLTDKTLNNENICSAEN